MCGRVTLALDKQTVLDILGDVLHVSNQPELANIPNYNIGPAQPMLSVIRHQGNNRAGYLRWGYIPSWSSDESVGFKLINTRSEGIDTKQTFKDAFVHKRCILLADSFYEWSREKVKKTFRFNLKNQSLMTFPGLYSTYTRANGEKLHTCSIITCVPNSLMEPIHHRMPVILSYDEAQSWLNETTTTNSLLSLLKPISSGSMNVYEVSSYVNNIQNNTIECIQPAQSQQTFL